MSTLIRLNRRAAPSQEAPATSPGVRALGVDPGLTRTGWALVEPDGHRYRLLQSGVIAARSPSGTDDLPGRLADGYRQFEAVLAETAPTMVVIEDLFTTPRFPKAALKMAHLRGVLCLGAARAGLTVLELTATTVKQRLTGNGHASKEQVQRMVFGLCDLPDATAPSDLSDAVALAVAGLHQLQVSALAGRRR